MEKKRFTTKDRMKEVLMVLGVSAFEFEKKCGLAHGFVARVSREITKKSREKIKSAYPNLNIDYIALGVGDVYEKEGETKDSIRDRVNQFCDFMNIKKRDFTKNTGIADSFLQHMSDNVRLSSLEKIYRAYPLLNPKWLEYGEGEMLLEKTKKKSTETVNDRIERLIEFLGITTTAFMAETKISSKLENVNKSTINKVVKRYPFVNPLWLSMGTGQMIEAQPKPMTRKILYAPLVSQRAFAGYLSGFADEEYIDTLDKIPYVEDKELSGNIIAIEVTGDSMDDGSAEAYRDGDVVLAKEVFPNEPLAINRYDFVVVHRSGILIKRIIKQTKYSITIHSLNPEYGDVEISLSDVLKIFVVKMKISKPMH